MNDKFRELAEQAGIEFDDSETLEPETIAYVTQSDLNKFAEMIVVDCIKSAEWVGRINTNPVEPVHTAHAIVKRIQKLFGVEK